MKLRTALGMLLLVLALLAVTGAASADVWLPASLTEIESQAFMNAAWLSGACNIPSGTRTIGAQAFSGCSGITSLTIPASVTYIGSGAFSGCTGLTGSVTIPEGCEVADDAFSGCVNLQVIYSRQDPSELYTWRISGGKVTITGYKGGKSVTSITIPAEIDGRPVTAIDSYAFSSSRYLTRISLPSTLEEIGTYAFAYCSRLQSVTVPSSVSILGRYAFYYCSALEGEINLVDAEVPTNAFTGCKYVSVFTYETNDDGTLSLSRYYGSQSSVSVPGRVDGKLVTAIGREAFSYRTGLKQVSLPTGITTVGQSAFYYCTALKSISLPYGVSSIGPSAFYNCTALSSAELPQSIVSIGSLAFNNCSSLRGSYTFIDAEVSASAFNGASGAEAWCYRITGENEVCLEACISTDTSLRIPAWVNDYAVTGIDAQALYGCKKVQSVTLPDTFTSIAAQAFYRCTTLQSIVIPEGVTVIGEGAFYGCTALRSVTIPASVTRIDTQAFNNCTSLYSLTVRSAETMLGPYAFAGCSSLDNVSMPGDYSNVGNLAFNGTPWLNDQVAVIAVQVTAGCRTSYEKALALHDWLVENTAYDTTYTHYGSEGVLFHGTGVCNAYTLTYSRLLTAVGVRNQTVTGVATDKSGVSGSHAWTLVQLDGSWYHVDTTWDDPLPDGRERHTYFCMTDREIARDHSWDTSAYPAANGTVYSQQRAELEAEDAQRNAETSGDTTVFSNHSGK